MPTTTSHHGSPGPAVTPGAAARPAPRAPLADRRTAALSASVIGCSLAVGAAADWLLPHGPVGVGGSLAALVLLAATALLGARAGRLGTEARALIAVAAAFACLLSWRASPALAALDLLSLGAALALLAAAMLGRGRRGVRGAWFRDYGFAAARAAASSAGAAPVVAFAAARWRPERARAASLDAATAARAVLVSAPLLLVFGALLTAADPVFAELAGSLFDLRGSAPLRHVVAALCFAWPVAGFLYAGVLAPRRAAAPVVRLTPFRVGATEVAVALGALDLLFLAFVAVQVRYLFGGTGGAAVAGLTYAEYARRGFFELVCVTALVLPVLLVGRNLIGRGSRAAERRYRSLGGTMLVLVLMIVASAMYRMRMYQAEYGLTEQRLYATVFMWWIVGVLGLFATTVLNGRRRGLAFGALSSGWAVVGALNVVNPDALIVRTNAARAAAGREFDAAYVTRLSADASPALASALPRLSGEARCRAAWKLVQPRPGPSDWRRWNHGQATAERIRRGAALRRAARACGTEPRSGTGLLPPVAVPAPNDARVTAP